MHLGELLALRPIAGAGVMMTLTRRCPLSCAHCSTSSTTDAEQIAAGPLERFAASMAGGPAPRVVMFTGGEPMLRPHTVTRLAASVRAAGARSALLSGMFFARDGGSIPTRLMEAITAVDHFSASLDAFHEREVERSDVFAALGTILDSGVPVSLHITGNGLDDPYLDDVTGAVRRAFGTQVPMLVGQVAAAGRAASWAAASKAVVDHDGPSPCALAAWPVVAFDGEVLACCNQQVVDVRPVPAHLSLGHIEHDTWPAVHDRLLGSPVLRMIRAVGPLELSGCGDAGSGDGRPSGYCERCRSLPVGEALPEVLAHIASGPAGALLDAAAGRAQAAAGPVTLARRHGAGEYAPLVELGTRVPGAGAALQMKLDLVAPALHASFAQLWQSDDLRGAYGRYLTVMHQILRASVPLMRQALFECERGEQRDALRDQAATYLRVHIEEERDHDVWLLDDLAAAGLDAQAVAARLPGILPARLVGAAQYWIAHHHPVALLGYIAALEYFAPAPELAGRLERATGLPAAAFATLRHHADLDARHRAEVLDLLDRMHVSETRRQAVAVCALHTLDVLIQLISSLAGDPAGPADTEGSFDERRQQQ